MVLNCYIPKNKLCLHSKNYVRNGLTLSKIRNLKILS